MKLLDKGDALTPSKSTLELLRRSGAAGLLVSKSGAGLVFMKPSVSRASKVKPGTHLEAVLQRSETGRIYGIADGAFYVVEDSSAAEQIRQASLEPVANFDLIDIASQEPGKRQSEHAIEQGVGDSLRASIKAGYRGSDIQTANRRLSVDELRKLGWETSA